MIGGGGDAYGFILHSLPLPALEILCSGFGCVIIINMSVHWLSSIYPCITCVVSAYVEISHVLSTLCALFLLCLNATGTHCNHNRLRSAQLYAGVFASSKPAD